MRVLMVNGEREDEIELGQLLRPFGVECVSMRISAVGLHSDQHVVWRMASGCSQLAPAEASPPRDSRGLVFELSDPPAGAIAAVLAIRSDRRFDGIPVVASLSIDHIDWVSRASDFDDFLFSPWSPIELIGRIYAAERRRARARSEAAVQRSEPVSIDTSARQVSIHGFTVRLTTRECALFSYLWAQRGSVLSREHLLEHVWGQSYQGGPRTVDVHIRRLRSKLRSALPIDTVRGGGYRMLAPARAGTGLPRPGHPALSCQTAESSRAAGAPSPVLPTIAGNSNAQRIFTHLNTSPTVSPRSTATPSAAIS